MCSRYKDSFAKLRAASLPTTPEARLAYTKLLESVYEVHSSTLIYVAKGLREIRGEMESSRDEFADKNSIQKIFDDFFLARIGIRMVGCLIFPSLDFMAVCFSTFSHIFLSSLFSWRRNI